MVYDNLVNTLEINELTIRVRVRYSPGKLVNNLKINIHTGLDASSLSQTHRWFTGPPYLLQSAETWPYFPGNIPLELDTSSPGVRSIGWAGAIIELSPIQQLIECSSSILSLCRTIGWIRRFVNRCRPQKQPTQPQNPLTKSCDPLSVAACDSMFI